MIARQTLNIYVQYLKNLPRLRGYSLVEYKGLFNKYGLGQGGISLNFPWKNERKF